MTAAELKAKIKSGEIGGAYILAGEEDYLKKYYRGELAKQAVPDEAFATFNRCIFDGADIDIREIAEAIKSPPMMSDFKLVEWRYPDIDGMKKGELEKIEEIADSLTDYPYAVLVLMPGVDGFDAGTARRPSKLAARLGKRFMTVNFEKSTDAQLISWLSRHFAAEHISAPPKALSALIFRSGHSMEVLRGEVSKLSAFAKANGLKRIGKKEIAEVLRLHEYKAGLVARAAGRTDPARLARAVQLATEADRELKRLRGDYSAIEKLICSL